MEQKEESKMSIFCNSDSKELDIKVNDNHIYFYSDVNKKSALELNIKLR